MPAELIAHRGEQSVGIGLLVARAQPRHERERQDRRGDVEIDRFEHRPSAFAGIGNPRLDPFHLGIFVKGASGEIEEPGADDAALTPDLGDLGEIEAEFLFLLQDREAFRNACIIPYSIPL